MAHPRLALQLRLRKLRGHPDVTLPLPGAVLKDTRQLLILRWDLGQAAQHCRNLCVGSLMVNIHCNK